jgi:Tol biopolymer transport system component
VEDQSYVPPGDRALTFTVYQIRDGNNTDTYLIDLESGEFRNITRSPGYYDEAEGIFPDGKTSCVEHASSLKTAWPLLDLYRLKLDGSGEMQRLTHFSDYRGFKATQGVVSDDGKYLAFQIGKSGQEAGVGYGFFIMDLEKAAPFLGPYKSYASKEGL